MTPTRVFDYKTDLGTFIVTPEMRCRFHKELPKVAREVHSHDGSAEIFVVLEGAIELDVDGARTVVDAGKAAYVPPFAKHTIRALNGEPAYIFMAVSPHKEPTHTYFAPDGTARPLYGAWRD